MQYTCHGIDISRSGCHVPMALDTNMLGIPKTYHDMYIWKWNTSNPYDILAFATWPGMMVSTSQYWGSDI